MLSKATQKWIRSLEIKKFRQELGLFLAEGTKVVTDLMPRLRCRLLLATDEWLEEHPVKAEEICRVENNWLERLSLQKTPQEVMAVFYIPTNSLCQADLDKGLFLALDTIQDPGNLGTILRIADWFGLDGVICSPDTADAFQPKTVQSSMGAVGRVRLVYGPLTDWLSATKSAIFGTFLEGEIIYHADLPAHGIIVMGNEGKGISPPVSSLITRKLFIPDYPLGASGSESLNVSAATAIVCSEFRRRQW
jgi:TrmH family RNA methyltransferase